MWYCLECHQFRVHLEDCIFECSYVSNITAHGDPACQLENMFSRTAFSVICRFSIWKDVCVCGREGGVGKREDLDIKGIS